jgi:hypothetical protein
MGEWSIVPFVLNLCTGWRLVASLTFQPFYFHGNVCYYPLKSKLERDPRAGLKALEKGKIFCCCTWPSADPPSSQGIWRGDGNVREDKSN